MIAEAQLLFSRQEYAQRLDAVRQKMRERGVDVLIADETEHIFYLTGFSISATRYQACIVPLDRDPIMVVRRLDVPAFLDHTWLEEYVPFGDVEDPVDAIAATLARHGWTAARIGVELDSQYLPVRQYEAIRKALPRATFVDFSRVLRDLRLRKSAQEIAYLRQAAAIADEAMRRAIATAGEGVGERAIAAVIARTFMELGASTAHIGRLVSGSRADAMHGSLGSRLLERGDLLHLELIPEVWGYSARIMRPTIIGAPTEEQVRVADALVRIQDEELWAMKPGAVARDVDRICREQVLGAGLRDVFDNATGYTLGYYGMPTTARMSDFTRIFLPSSEWLLEPGMVFHMYVSAHGMTFSETVLVGEDGPERLTQLDRILFVR